MNFSNPYRQPYQYQPAYPTMQSQYMPMQNAQPLQWQQSQAPQGELPFQDVRFVTTEEAKSFILMPNSRVLLIDKPNNLAFVKTADNMGQSSTRFFKINEINENGTPIEKATEKQSVDMQEFVKKSDLVGLVTVQEYNSVLEQLRALQGEIRGLKTNDGNANGTQQ